MDSNVVLAKERIFLKEDYSFGIAGMGKDPMDFLEYFKYVHSCFTSISFQVVHV